MEPEVEEKKPPGAYPPTKEPQPEQEETSKFSLKKLKRKAIISEEIALDQIMLLVDRYDIDIDSMDTEKQAAMEETLSKLQTAVMNGWLSVENIDGEVKVTQYIQYKSSDASHNELVYREMRANHHVKMGNKTEGNQHKKMLTLLKAMCETTNGHLVIEKLRASDASTAEYLSLLFL